MAASATDKFRKSAPNFSTTIGSDALSNSGDQTASLNSVTGLPTDTATDLTYNRVDPDGDPTNDYETATGVISGSNFTNQVRGQEGTASGWPTGTVVEALMTAKMWNDLIDGILVEHGQDGKHSRPVTNMPLTTPKITTSINDVNGNEVIKTPATTSAINEITVINAATNDNPTISATGGDTNIGINIKPKGTGVVAVDGAENFAADAGSDDTYVITIKGITAYATGQKFSFKANTINTGAATLNVNSLGAKTIKKNYNSDLADGDIAANQLVEVIYDGTNMQLLSPVNNTFKGAKVYLSASASISNGGETAISWNAEEYDTDSMHDNSTNPSRITINTAGKYQIHSSVNFLPAATGRRYSEFYKNGSVLNGGLTQLITTGASGTTTLHGQITLDLAAADYLEVKVYQDSGGAIDVGGGNSDSRCIFEVYKID